MICVQAPVSVLAKNITDTQSETYSLAVQAEDYGISQHTQDNAQWKHDNIGWWYQNADGTYPKNLWQLTYGSWYHFDQYGYMQTGWLLTDNTW